MHPSAHLNTPHMLQASAPDTVEVNVAELVGIRNTLLSAQAHIAGGQKLASLSNTSMRSNRAWHMSGGLAMKPGNGTGGGGTSSIFRHPSLPVEAALMLANMSGSHRTGSSAVSDPEVQQSLLDMVAGRKVLTSQVRLRQPGVTLTYADIHMHISILVLPINRRRISLLLKVIASVARR